MSHSTEKLLITVWSSGNERALWGSKCVWIVPGGRDGCRSHPRVQLVHLSQIPFKLRGQEFSQRQCSPFVAFSPRSLSENFPVSGWFRTISMLGWFYNERVLQVKASLKEKRPK